MEQMQIIRDCDWQDIGIKKWYLHTFGVFSVCLSVCDALASESFA